MFKSGEDLPAAVHGYVRLFDLIDSLDNPDLKDKEKIEQLERDKAGLNNILRISQNKIKTLRKRDNFRLGNLSDTDLELIADRNRKINGKINYSAIGRELGCSHETVRREINKRDLAYLIEPPIKGK